MVRSDLHDYRHGRVGTGWLVLSWSGAQLNLKVCETNSAICRYDTILMGNFFAYPSFQQKFGQNYGGDIGWQVSAPWQTGLGMASTVGCIFGT